MTAQLNDIMEYTLVHIMDRNGTHKTVRTDPNTTCKEVLQSVLKKIGLQESIIQYGLYIQYAISGKQTFKDLNIVYVDSLKDGRVAEDDEIMANVNPNTWDSVTRIYLCRRAEFSSTYTRSRCKSMYPTVYIMYARLYIYRCVVC